MSALIRSTPRSVVNERKCSDNGNVVCAEMSKKLPLDFGGKTDFGFYPAMIKKNWLTRLGSTKDAEVSVCDPYGWCHFLGTPWVQQNRGSRPSALTTDHLYRVHVRPLSPRGGAGAHSSLWARAGSHPGQTEYRQTRNQTSNSVILFHRCLFSLRSLFRHSAS